MRLKLEVIQSTVEAMKSHKHLSVQPEASGLFKTGSADLCTKHPSNPVDGRKGNSENTNWAKIIFGVCPPPPMLKNLARIFFICKKKLITVLKGSV